MKTNIQMKNPATSYLNKLAYFLKENCFVFLFVAISIALELISIASMNYKPVMTEPWYYICVLAFLCSILFITNNKLAQVLVASFFILIQTAIDIGFVFLFDSNGTIFDYSMINQRNDAFGTIEDYSLRTEILYTAVVLFSAFLSSGIVFSVYNKRIYKKSENKEKKYPRFSNGLSKLSKIIVLVSLIVFFAILIVVPIADGKIDSKKSYIKKLYNNTGNNYQSIGIFGNAIYEVIFGTMATSVDTSGLDKVADSIYAEKCTTSKYNGVSAGNNLVMIMVESFEWYPVEMYPELASTLYPNITRLMNQGVVCENFYAREKTDTSEVLSVLGNYPTGKYVHYDFPNNEYPFSLPNLYREAMLNDGASSVAVNSFHQNWGEFYNRNKSHEAFGFDTLYSIEDMVNFGLKNTWGSERERNLDSLAIEKMKDEMFLTDEPFFSYWITFSMHGFYEERSNLADYYQIMDDYGVFPVGDTTKSQYLRTYAAAVMDFDKALGIMFADLENKNLIDNTTILVFADHNTYYSNLSAYAKDISERYNSELYNVPMIIFDTKLTAAMTSNHEPLIISKFTTTSDIVPTVLDLFGIAGWKNLYFGTTIFDENTESIIYSRAYGIFVTDKLVCYSVNHILWKCDGFTSSDKKIFISRAKIHLKKLEIIDKIYYSNYFKKYTYQTA